MSIPVHWKCEIHGHLGMFGWLEKRFLLSVNWETGPCTKLSNDHYLQLLPIIPSKILMQLHKLPVLLFCNLNTQMHSPIDFHPVRSTSFTCKSYAACMPRYGPGE